MSSSKLTMSLATAAVAVAAFGPTALAQAGTNAPQGLGIVQKHPDIIAVPGVPRKHPDIIAVPGVPQKHPDIIAVLGVPQKHPDIIAVLRLSAIVADLAPGPGKSF